MKKIFLLLAILTAVTLFNCGGKKEKEEKKEEIALPDSLQPQKLVGIGRIEPEAKIASLYSDVSGVVDSLYINAGDTVKNLSLIHI